MIPTWIHSVEQARDWLDVTQQLDLTERSGLYVIHNSERALEVMVTNLWLPHAKTSPGKDWTRIATELKDVGEIARRTGIPRLFLEVRRALVAVTAAYIGNLDASIEIANSTLAEAAGDAQTEFIICDAVARQLSFAGRISESMAWWRRALAAQALDNRDSRVSALTFAGVTAESLGDTAACRYLEEAASLAESLPQSSWLTAFRALGEYAICLWKDREKIDAYGPWSRAIGLLRANRDSFPEWKSVFRISGNAASYFAHTLKREKSDWKYSVPAPGMLLDNAPELASSYRPAQEWLLPMNMGEFAWIVSKHHDAERWAGEALETGAGMNPQDVLYLGMRPALWILRLPELLRREAFEELLSAAIQLTVALGETVASEPLTEEDRAGLWLAFQV